MTGQPAKSIAILQSNYIPWKGYFDLMASVDEFLIFDEAQFTRRDWRNRNKIVVDGRLHWLTIPVDSKGRFDAPIHAITIADRDWAEKHWKTIRHAYRKAPFFDRYAAVVEDLYARVAGLELLTRVNEAFLNALARELGVATPFSRTESIPRAAKTATGRLVEICQARGATAYVSGPAARSYIDTAQFEAAGIALGYADYGGYPTYGQELEPFEHGVSVLDLLFRCGPQARDHLKSPCRRETFVRPANDKDAKPC